MADRGITFSAAMVQALLAGRKTQTRRLATFVMPQSNGDWHCRGNGGGMMGMDDALVREWGWSYAPHQTGDRLYVREHWKTPIGNNGVAPRDLDPLSSIHYLADGTERGKYRIATPLGRHRQAMHMPRWASRLTLLVTDVRVQRLQDISEEDAIAEGIGLQDTNPHGPFGYTHDFSQVPSWATARRAFQHLWDSLHTDPGTRWEDNPWIYGVMFTVRRGNIDNLEGAN